MLAPLLANLNRERDAGVAVLRLRCRRITVWYLASWWPEDKRRRKYKDHNAVLGMAAVLELEPRHQASIFGPLEELQSVNAVLERASL